MSTINITPFTDVLLVLLIIFIILASVTKEPPFDITVRFPFESSRVPLAEY